MNMTQLDEAVSLEMLMALSPMCEDDHSPEGWNATPPKCETLAVARIVQSCQQESWLICRPLVEWVLEDPVAECTEHARTDHVKIFWL